MKKILILLLLIIPFIVKAETCDINKITIEEISIDNRNGNVIEKTEATIDNNIDLDLNMNNVGDNITYKITIKNNSYEDIEINEENIKNSEYIKYSIYNEEESLLIKARTSKTVFLKIKYEKEVPEELLVNDTYDDEMELSLALSSVGLINPKTGIVNYSVIIFAILLLGLSFYIVFRNKKYLYVLIIGFAFVIPIVLNASCKYNINIKANVKITSLAEFDIGMIVNEKMRLLAGDNQIKSFKRSNTISNEIKALADSQIDEMSRYVVSEEELNEMFELFKANADVIDKENGIKEKDGVINYCITRNYGEYCIKEYDMKYQLERSIAIIIRGDNFNDEYIIYNNDKCKLEIIETFKVTLLLYNDAKSTTIPFSIFFSSPKGILT